MMDLTGKIALVTGAASNPGLGNATAHRLAAAGATLFVTDVDADGAEACAGAIRDRGGIATALGHDIALEADWEDVFDGIMAAHDRLDILVNNAGIAVIRPIETLEPADFIRQIEVNLLGTFLGTRRAIAAMRRTGGGAIVNISSVAGIVGFPGTAAYAASKGGIRLMTKSVALECARDNIRVNSVHPGSIMTNLQKVAIAHSPEQSAKINATIPMGRIGEPDDIANCVLFLVSSASAYITGAEFVVDGGLTAQ